jgi:hypothetical protein
MAVEDFITALGKLSGAAMSTRIPCGWNGIGRVSAPGRAKPRPSCCQALVGIA